MKIQFFVVSKQNEKFKESAIANGCKEVSLVRMI